MEPNHHTDNVGEDVQDFTRTECQDPNLLNNFLKKSVYLSTKKAAEFLLNGTLRNNVCRYCLKVSSSLSELDQIMQIARGQALYRVSVKEMVASFHPIKVVDDENFPNSICDKCLDRTISSYLFKQQCEQSERALRNCFEDIFEKLEKSDPLKQQKRRGRPKSKSKRKVLHVEHMKVIDYAEPMITLVNICSQLLTNNYNPQPHTCAKCGEVLPNMQSLVSHEKSHPKSMWYNCQQCGGSFAKKYYLKKHLLAAHNPWQPDIKASDTDFSCQECGNVSSDYHSHLQHIEKHKFKVVMEHLVEKKMDKLCAICLKKGSGLSNMDNMICLHGGYPEIMGDVPIYNVLESIFPQKSSHKYQELLIPSEANTQRITKIYHQDVQAFVFSLPLIVSNDTFVTSNANVYMFSNPYYGKPELRHFLADHCKTVGDGTLPNSLGFLSSEHETDISKYDDDTVTKNNNSFIVSKPILKPVKQFQLSKNYNFLFSKPTLDLSPKNKADCHNTCKTCWIFKKPMCNKCLIRTENIVRNNQTCHMCWLFKECANCANCNRATSVNKAHIDDIGHRNNEPILINNLENNQGNYIRDTTTKHPVVKEINGKKRKIEEVADCNKDISNIPFKSKKSKWQCQICLTSNFKRELCLCCDSPRLCNDDKPTFNFGRNKTNTFQENNNEIPYIFKSVLKTMESEKIEENNNIGHLRHDQHVENPVENEQICDEILKSNLDANFTSESGIDNANDNENIFCDVISDTPMVEVIEQEQSVNINGFATNDNFLQCQTLEEMDVSEGIPQPQVIETVISSTTLNLPPISPFIANLPMFTFNMGSTVTEDNNQPRKFKKAIRRKGSSFHK